MSKSKEHRRWVGNQLESLYLAGLTHVATELTEDEMAATGNTSPGNELHTYVTPTDVEKIHPKTDRSSMEPHSPKATQQTNSTRNIKIESSWKTRLDGPFNAPYMASLSAFLRTEKADGNKERKRTTRQNQNKSRTSE